MERSTFITLRSRVDPILSRAQLTEILRGPENADQSVERVSSGNERDVLGNDITEQLHFQSPCGRLSDIDVHEDDRSLRRSHRALGVAGREKRSMI
jgi:hypothetical protein